MAQVNGYLCSKKIKNNVCMHIFISGFQCNFLADQCTNIIGQEDNQGRLRNSNPASSLGSIALSDKSLDNDGLLLLPKLKRNNFNVPRFISPNDWIRSQCNHLKYKLLL